MSDWTLEQLTEWDTKICEIGKNMGLDWFPIVYEVIDYYDMISAMSHHGMPSHYNHWSYGKSFESILYRYNEGETGLPYEMIINSNPSTAYLMRENPLFLQILIMAHCVGHSDFFKNNRAFAHTNPTSVVASMRASKKQIQSYIEDPSIGIEKVEKVIDCAHALAFNTELLGRDREAHASKKKKFSDLIRNDQDGTWHGFDLTRIPLEPDYDLLAFIGEHGKHLEDWEREVINLIREESVYFAPQMRTKICNEGFAVWTHKKIIEALDLPQELHIPFMKSHNQVVRPAEGTINPYYMGLYFFERIEKEQGIPGVMLAREFYHDESMIREFVDEKTCEDLGLFTYSLKKSRSSESIISIDDVPSDGWKEIRQSLIDQIGANQIPKIYVDDLRQDGTLILRHDHEGRDLDLEHAEHVVKQIKTLWKRPVKLFTVLEDEDFEI